MIGESTVARCNVADGYPAENGVDIPRESRPVK
jgi:hypothetical protein